MRRVLLLSVSALALVLQACASGPYIPPEERIAQERAAYRAYYDDSERANRLIRAGDLAAGAAIYQSYWTSAFTGALPPGSPTPANVSTEMESLARAFPGLLPYWKALIPAAEERVAADAVTTDDLGTFILLLEAAREDAPVVRRVEAIRGNDRRIAVWRSERWVSDRARKMLVRAQRPDLAQVIERNPLQQIADATGDAAFGIAGNIVAPILGPGMAGK